MFKFTRVAPIALFFTLALSAIPQTARADDYANGHYESCAQNVLVCAAHTERVWVEPCYKSVYFNGCYQNVCVSVGYWRTYCVPARYETRHTRCWVPNTYVNRYDNNYGKTYVNRY